MALSQCTWPHVAVRWRGSSGPTEGAVVQMSPSSAAWVFFVLFSQLLSALSSSAPQTRAETRHSISTSIAPAPKHTKYRKQTPQISARKTDTPAGGTSFKGRSFGRSSNRIKLEEGGIKTALLRKNKLSIPSWFVNTAYEHWCRVYVSNCAVSVSSIHPVCLLEERKRGSWKIVSCARTGFCWEASPRVADGAVFLPVDSPLLHYCQLVFVYFSQFSTWDV